MDMEGMPPVHLERARDDPELPGWPEWFAQFGHRREGAEARPQLQRFVDWLRHEAAETERYLTLITDS